jgi:transposase
MHLIAVTQIAHDTPGRAYYDRKIGESKTTKEALRALEATDQRRRLASTPG